MLLAERRYNQARAWFEVAREVVLSAGYARGSVNERKQAWRNASEAWAERERALEALMAATEE